jgi:hypothetical protein
MTNDLFPKHDELVNRELSLEELDAVAAGFSLGGFVHSVGHGVKSFFTKPVLAKLGFAVLLVGGLLFGSPGSSSAQNRQN